MLVTNQTSSDIYFGPLHLGAGVGTTLTVDDTTATSLYLTDDAVADALNNAYNAGKITVSGAAQPFPRPTGTPEVLHGSGNPEGLVYAPQGSLYMRRDGVQSNGGGLYVKTTGVTLNTGWLDLPTASGASALLPPGALAAFGGSTAPSGWLICDGSAVSRSVYSLLFSAIGTLYGSGDGSTTFNLPDLRGRVPVGLGTNTDVSTLGNSDGIATVANRRPKHGHGSHTHTTGMRLCPSGGGSDWHAVQGGLDGTVTTSSVTVGQASPAPQDTPAYLVVNYIIKT